MALKFAGRSSPDDDVVRITTASEGADVDRDRRVRRYAISMAIRTACFVGVTIAAINGWVLVGLIFLVGAAVIPIIAVVMANSVTPPDTGFELPDQGHHGRELQ